ncbi:hypothetical protein BJP36_35350 [Moorena producens JHB]|uniref:Uncharacterized protein n=1 Tax=Moorena producens (strain JHB) TaxID=1454205 RepID=A0A1D9G9Y4_MOOP1|nr:hypothetical protein [Moorena producens]AOY84423.2 hypothetical protein BJP36_35350 [Moorena producens JHB]
MGNVCSVRGRLLSQPETTKVLGKNRSSNGDIIVKVNSIGKKVASFFLLVALCLSVFVANPGVAQARELYGAVDSNGSVMYGKGFESKKYSESAYLIKFEEKFSSTPGATVSIFGDSWRSFQQSASIVDVNPNYFVVQTSTPDMPADSAFTFTVVGD